MLCALELKRRGLEDGRRASAIVAVKLVAAVQGDRVEALLVVVGHGTRWIGCRNHLYPPPSDDEHQSILGVTI